MSPRYKGAMTRKEALEAQVTESLQRLAKEFSDLGKELPWVLSRAFIHRAVHNAAEGRVETIGGGIAVDGVAAGGTLELQSHNGVCDIRLSATRIPHLDLSSRAGIVKGRELRGSPVHGHIIARSFKGNVTARIVESTR